MRLQSALNELNNEELVYIGSKSAFFFIGHPQEFIEQAEDISAMWIRKCEKAKDKAYNNLIAHEEVKPKVGVNGVKQIYNVTTRKKENVPVPYEELYKKWQQREASLKKTLENAEMAFEKFKPFLERVVKDSYKRIDGTGTVVIIRGSEVGNFWTYQEYLKKHIMTLEELEAEESEEENERE